MEKKLNNSAAENEKPLWLRCSNCREFIYRRIFEDNLKVCPICNFHYRIDLDERLEITFDGGKKGFREMYAELEGSDILGFNADEPYSETLARNRAKTGRKEAVVVGTGLISGVEVAAIIFDFNFMGGSMGFVVGEKVVRLFDYASQNNLPVVAFVASGGARMQEGMISLYQMARTVIAAEKFKRSSQRPFISFFLNPTTGGVLASFVSIADKIAAEPNALIGFAGPRVIEKTIGKKLPQGFQRAEFLKEKGLIDTVIPRSKIRESIARWCAY